MLEINKIKLKQKITIMCDKCIIALLIVIFLPFIVLFEGSNRVFQFLADFNQNCSEFITDIGSLIYQKITDLIIKIVGEE